MQNNTRNIDACTNRPTPTKLSQSHKPFLQNNYSHSIGSRNAVLKYKNISNMKTEAYTLQVNTLNRTNLNAMSWKQIGEKEPIFCTCSIEALEISCQTYKHTHTTFTVLFIHFNTVDNILHTKNMEKCSATKIDAQIYSCFSQAINYTNNIHCYI